MKPIAKTTLSLLLVFAGIGWGLADGPTAMLPKDGAWVRYHASTQKAGTPELTATMTLKSLKKVVVNGVSCQWFESEYVPDERERRERGKFLVSEKTFTSSERPLNEALKFLQRDDPDPLVEIAPDSQGWMPVSFLFFPGFLKNATLTDTPRTVAYQRGTLSIPKAYVGTYKWWRKDRTPETTTVFESKYQVWLHPDLPTGFAHAKVRLGMSYQGKENRSYDLEYTLQDFGDDAKPAIPEESAPAR